MGAGGVDGGRDHGRRSLAGGGHAAPWRDSRLSSRGHRPRVGRAGAQRLRHRGGGRHGDFVLRPHEAALHDRSQFRGAGFGSHLRDGNSFGQVPSQRAGQRAALGGRGAGDLRGDTGIPVIWLAIPAIAAAAYYCLVIIAAVRWRPARVTVRANSHPPLSILKPIHGRDPRFYEAILSHAAQDYPEFEILFGVSDPCDPAIEDIRRLKSEFPERRLDMAVVKTGAPNAKVGVLAELAKRARYPLLLVNDSDIVVPPGYLGAVTAPLGDPAIGLVTCLYRAKAESWASRCEALGVATEFAPSVLVARLLDQAEFALGSTMVFRAGTLSKIGGFETLADYLADDYQLGRRISELGYRIEFAPVVVETDLGGESWALMR